MIRTPRGCALDSFMKFCVARVGTAQKTLQEIWKAMISEFQNPQLESKCIPKIKEIKQALAEIVWDFK